MGFEGVIGVVADRASFCDTSPLGPTSLGGGGGENLKKKKNSPAFSANTI